jgi:chromosome segregation ATPase
MTHDAVTRVADDLTESFLTLEKEITDRRSYTQKRGEDANSARQFRQEVEREYRAEIRQLREESDQKTVEITKLEARLANVEARFESYRDANHETLTAAKMIVHAGMVFRYAIIGIVGITAAIGGISAVMETIRAWLQK